MTWQPIETAPKVFDSQILAFFPEQDISPIRVAYWDGWNYVVECDSSCDQPTHWMPLPAPPQT